MASNYQESQRTKAIELIKSKNPVFYGSDLGMERTWRSYLQDQSKYMIITPEKLLTGINNKTHSELLEYLKIRYW